MRNLVTFYWLSYEEAEKDDPCLDSVWIMVGTKKDGAKIISSRRKQGYKIKDIEYRKISLQDKAHLIKYFNSQCA